MASSSQQNPQSERRGGMIIETNEFGDYKIDYNERYLTTNEEDASYILSTNNYTDIVDGFKLRSNREFRRSGGVVRPSVTIDFESNPTLAQYITTSDNKIIFPHPDNLREARYFEDLKLAGLLNGFNHELIAEIYNELSSSVNRIKLFSSDSIRGAYIRQANRSDISYAIRRALIKGETMLNDDQWDYIDNSLKQYLNESIVITLNHKQKLEILRAIDLMIVNAHGIVSDYLVIDKVNEMLTKDSRDWGETADTFLESFGFQYVPGNQIYSDNTTLRIVKPPRFIQHVATGHDESTLHEYGHYFFENFWNTDPDTEANTLFFLDEKIIHEYVAAVFEAECLFRICGDYPEWLNRDGTVKSIAGDPVYNISRNLYTELKNRFPSEARLIDLISFGFYAIEYLHKQPDYLQRRQREHNDWIVRSGQGDHSTRTVSLNREMVDYAIDRLNETEE